MRYKVEPYSYNELIKLESSKCQPEPMDSEDPFFLLYTSGSTGKPKAAVHDFSNLLKTISDIFLLRVIKHTKF